MEHIHFYDLETLISLLTEYQHKGMKYVGFDVCDKDQDIVVLCNDDDPWVFKLIDLEEPDA